MLIVTTKVQQTNNQSRDKRRATSKDKTKKQESFNKILATEMTQSTPKR